MSQENEQAQPENVQPEPVPEEHKKAKKIKVKPPSRGERFVDAAQTLMDAIGDLRSAWEEYVDAVNSAREELKGVQEEYQEWYDNMPESLQQGPTGEKLSAICDINLEDDIEEPDFDTLEGVAQECLDADLPLGFGRD
jgi:hypothetical protein